MFQYLDSKRGELRQLAATKNKLLNSTASLFQRLNESAFYESPALFGAGLLLCGHALVNGEAMRQNYLSSNC
jgi:hypothetical protein